MIYRYLNIESARNKMDIECFMQNIAKVKFIQQTEENVFARAIVKALGEGDN